MSILKLKSYFLELGIKAKLFVLAFLISIGTIPSGIFLYNSISHKNKQEIVETNVPENINGEVAGLSTQNTNPSPTSSPILNKKSPTPSISPNNQTNNNQTSNGNNNATSNSASNSQDSNNTQSASPTPSSSSSPNPSPTSSPDNSTFEASMTTDGNTVTINANKNLQKCKFVESSSGGGQVVSNNGDGTDLINGSVCTINRGNPQFPIFGVKVTSNYGEEKILGSSPPNYW
ncbi:MAG: hypothetical protein AAB512_02425 [Patescibacteria group bacterium]